MTAAIANRVRAYRGELPRQFTKPVIAADIIFKAVMVGLDASGDAGPGGVAGIGPIVGLSMHQVDNSGGAAGDLEVRLETGQFAIIDDGVTTEADLPALMYAVDDSTISLDSTGTRQLAGVGISMDPDGAKVNLWISPLAVQDVLALGAQIVDSGVAVLVAGAVTVLSANVRADSVIITNPNGISGSTDFSYLDSDTITPGVSFTIEAKTIAHAADGDAVGNVFFAVINP